ncbi:winged helix-turn-helix domain-containing protein [Bradyrhizobium sp. Tv2a-2]|uniref:helix-turn-helix domain-containing protein n=1 Tax=Bradyrhizobium sp. Tv2a-2 TaxID=113395 RepID=UPI0004146292|nr:winged helix-turn-helix domain-containing protein [Bradyrhizobium sp. Tv2a-2]
MTAICPCCGNEMPIGRSVQFRLESHTLISSDYAVVFTAFEAEIFDLLWKNRNTGRVVTGEAIFDRLYALDPNGGPDTKVTDVLINRMRRKLAETDIEIANVYGRGFFLRSKTSKQEQIA